MRYYNVVVALGSLKRANTYRLALFYFTLRYPYFEGSEKTQTNCQYFCIISFFFCFVFLASFYFLSFLFDLL